MVLNLVENSSWGKKGFSAFSAAHISMVSVKPKNRTACSMPTSFRK